MTLNLITSEQATAHITPKQDAHWHNGLMDVSDWIASGSFVPTIATNNEINIAEGVGSLQGRFFDIDTGTIDSVTIDSGSQGMNRIDIICFTITVNNDSTQSGDWEVIKGSPTEGTPTAPTIPEGDLDAGDTKAYLPVIQVELTGINITSAEVIADQYDSCVHQDVIDIYIDAGWITGE